MVAMVAFFKPLTHRHLVTPHAWTLTGDPLGPVPNVWQMLSKWVQASPHRWRRTHELERIVNPGAPDSDLVLELYLPIEED